MNDKNIGWTDEQIRDVTDKVPTKPTKDISMSKEIVTRTTRNIIVIGCGEGGCNIASGIAKAFPDETYVIAYNTSNRNMDNIVAHARVIAEANDGSGKVRQYSKEAFRNGVHRRLMNAVNMAVEDMGSVSYFLVCSTTDGGTGSGVSPMICKLLMNNSDIPVIMLGVYPNIGEDATAQYNTLEWQNEVTQVGVPYFILDNNISGLSKPETYSRVNRQGVYVAGFLTGRYLGNTPISIIDDQNLFMLVHHLGKRMAIAVDTIRPSTGQSLDDYILGILENNYQPTPENPRGIGLLVKASADYLNKIDPTLPRVREKYGEPVLNFQHLEESDGSVMIGILMTGCSEPRERIEMIKSRYDDIMYRLKDDTSCMSSIMSETKNPLGTVPKAVVFGDSASNEDYDESALDL